MNKSNHFNNKKVLIIAGVAIAAIITLFICLNINKSDQVKNDSLPTEEQDDSSNGLTVSIDDALKREEVERIEGLAFTKAKNISVVMADGTTRVFYFKDPVKTNDGIYEQEIIINDILSYTSYSLDGELAYMIKDSDENVLYDIGNCLYSLSDTSYKVLNDDGSKMEIVLDGSPYTYEVEYIEIMSERSVVNILRKE